MKMVDLICDFPGDTSVGIFPARWEIKDAMYADDTDREEIREAFNDAFNTLTGGGHGILFSDEEEWEA